MRKSIRFAGQAALVAALGLLVGAACQKAAPPERPQLTLHFKATTPAGEPLARGVRRGVRQGSGHDRREGRAHVPVHGGVGDEFTTTAKLERDGHAVQAVAAVPRRPQVGSRAARDP